jgi:hypothetical protein
LFADVPVLAKLSQNGAFNPPSSSIQHWSQMFVHKWAGHALAFLSLTQAKVAGPLGSWACAPGFIFHIISVQISLWIL